MRYRLALLALALFTGLLVVHAAEKAEPRCPAQGETLEQAIPSPVLLPQEDPGQSRRHDYPLSNFKNADVVGQGEFGMVLVAHLKSTVPSLLDGSKAA
jgi:hypothetical protein